MRMYGWILGGILGAGACGPSDDEPTEVRMTVVGVGHDANTVQYAVEVDAETYLLTFRRAADGLAEMFLSGMDGDAFAYASRDAAGNVEVASLSGLAEQAAGGTYEVTEDVAPKLEVFQWMLMDRGVVARLPPVDDAAQTEWVQGLDMIHAFDPAEDRSGALDFRAQTCTCEIYSLFGYEVYRSCVCTTTSGDTPKLMLTPLQYNH